MSTVEAFWAGVPKGRADCPVCQGKGHILHIDEHGNEGYESCDCALAIARQAMTACSCLEKAIEPLIDRALNSDCRPLECVVYGLVGKLRSRAPELSRDDLVAALARAAEGVAYNLDLGHEPEPSEQEVCRALAELLENKPRVIGKQVILCQEGMKNGITRGLVVAETRPGTETPWVRHTFTVELDCGKFGQQRWCVPATCVGDPPEETFESLLPADWLPSPDGCDYVLYDGLRFHLAESKG